jgi:hypothetical protein
MHFLDKFLTNYDEDLSFDSYIDPVGTLIIWSAFGRQVFRNRINSVSNDVRNYTVNLLHHFLVRKLANDDEVRLSPSLQRHYQSKDNLGFKQACLIFLENLFVYSMLRHGSRDGVETGGILGIVKARRQWHAADRNPVVRFTHEPSGQILARQLGLGVSGRYKTPLIEMGFFDSHYGYHRPAHQARWAEAENFITRPNSPLGKLQRVAYAFLKERVLKLHHGGTLLFGDDVDDKLKRGYAEAFPSPRAVGAYARRFWLDQTGLDEGAAGALLAVLEGAQGLPPRRVLERALAREMEPSERAKLDRIAELEPFLSDCALLFTLMAGERTHSIGEVEKQWHLFRRGADRLPGLARQVAGHAREAAVKGSEAASRLSQLQTAAQAGCFEAQVRALAVYHGRVMRSRDQLSWLSVEEDGTIKVQARTLPRPDPDKWRPGDWSNGYYLREFESFVHGVQEGGE